MTTGGSTTMTNKTTYTLTGSDGDVTLVTSERAARAEARRMLGCDRVYQTPTADGWQYWPVGSTDQDAPCVTVTLGEPCPNHWLDDGWCRTCGGW